MFPHFFASRNAQTIDEVSGRTSRDAAGLNTMDVMNNMRRLGRAHLLIRGDGVSFGWFVIERLSRGHTYLGPEGVGQQVSFEATFQRVPVPDDPQMYLSNLFGATGGGAG